MKRITDVLEVTLKNTQPRDNKKLSEQQKYYNSLISQGVAVKQTYSLKPLSMI